MPAPASRVVVAAVRGFSDIAANDRLVGEPQGIGDRALFGLADQIALLPAPVVGKPHSPRKPHNEDHEENELENLSKGVHGVLDVCGWVQDTGLGDWSYSDHHDSIPEASSVENASSESVCLARYLRRKGDQDQRIRFELCCSDRWRGRRERSGMPESG